MKTEENDAPNTIKEKMNKVYFDNFFIKRIYPDLPNS